MEVMSCSNSQRDEQVENDGDTVMDELLLDLDVDETTPGNNLLVKSEPNDSKTENHCHEIEETEPTEPKWLQPDEPIALWVKWRGKWQAGIRCARADWPLMTLRGKPTHDRKQYFVIFFPHTKNYSWADMQLVRSINEFPDPIAYKSHKIGLKMVKDLTVARRNIMRKLTIRMLNIVDQFHSEVVVEEAKDIITWKEFAMEASRSTSYHDLGRMLVKLQTMIVQRYMNPVWLEKSFSLWIQKCNDAMNAESIELLNEEFENCIEWNEVKSISDSQMVFSEWKTWKQDVTKWFSISRRSVAEKSQQNSNSDVQASRKRPKLEIRRAETTNVSHDTTPQDLAAIDSDFFNTPAAMKGEIAIMDTPGTVSDLWDGIVVEAGGSKEANEVSHTQVGNIFESGVKKPFCSGNKSQQCSAFIESKGRQCVRWANEGDIYCCVHLASRFATKSVKIEGSPAAETPMCGGVTVLGTKCKHRSLPGLLFCKKHRPHTEIEANSSPTPVKRKVPEITSTIDTSQCQDLVLFREIEANGTTSFSEMLEHSRIADDLCVGSCSENSYVPCNELATKHTLYCELHLPNWLKRARNGKSRIISKEVFVYLLKGCSSREVKLSLHQACEIFYKLFKSLVSLRNSVPMDQQLDWAISEASSDDNGVGDFLMKLIYHEKERLSRIWGFLDEEDVTESPIQLEETDKWSFRGFACAICLDSFVNRKLLETHVEERHHVLFAEKCMLLQCIPCGSHFGDKEQLLVHVEAVHQSEYKTLTVASRKPEAEASNLQIVVSENNESPSGVNKFICKFCGVKFNLLPDLGRHHQAEHMEPGLVSSRGPKKGLRFNNYLMKSGRLSRPNKFKKSLGAVSYRIRNRRRMQGSKSLMTGLSSPLRASDSRDFDRSTDDHSPVVSKILFAKMQKVKHRPNNVDILFAARTACCRVSLETSLEAKFGILPERVYLKAAKLCGDNGVQVQWHREDFVCSNGCKRSNDSNLLSPLIPREENCRISMSIDTEERSNNEVEVDECHCIMEAHHFSKRPFGKTVVLCNDMSFGKEQVMIRYVLDEDCLDSGEKPWDGFSYVTKSILSSSMDLANEVCLTCSSFP